MICYELWFNKLKTDTINIERNKIKKCLMLIKYFLGVNVATVPQI